MFEPNTSRDADEHKYASRAQQFLEQCKHLNLPDEFKEFILTLNDSDFEWKANQ